MPPHLFVIHFPVALVLAGALVDLVGVALGDRSVRMWGGRLLIAGGVATLVAFATGEGAKLAGMGSGMMDLARLEIHQQWGSVGAWAVALASLLRGLWRTRLTGSYGWINLGAALGAAVIVVAITVTGTLIRHG
jgi:uncharacterized membrane protein